MGEFKGFMKYEKQSLSELSLVERLKNHDAFQQRFSRDEASVQGARCMDCGTPFCQTGLPFGRETIGCPIGNYVPEWNDLVYRQDFKAAYQRLSETNNFPEFTGRVCPAPCEQSCVMKINRESVAIKGIERTIIDEAYDNGWVKPKYPKQRLEQSVAIVGSGPAGLSAAEELNYMGYQVTVFERAAEAGGLLMYGIPNMKLDKDVVRRRITLMTEAGITFKTNTNIGVDISREELEQTYDAIILCTGAQKARDLPLEGRMGQGIHFAMDYLTEQTQLLNGEIDEPTITAKGKNVIIIGAGDTGADCVATALRENCKSIVQFNKYTKAPEEIAFESNTSWPLALPVFKMDYAHKEYEARFGREPRAYGVQTMRYDVDHIGNVRGVYTQILEETPEGMVVVDGTERHWTADLVLLSIGFEGTEPTVPRSFDIATQQNKIIANDKDYRTNKEKIFAAGDARRGQSLVVWAIKEGRAVAQSVDKFLKQKVFV
ncbi:glutamate synthase subunit beta [Staphylococcus haemolyticus]|uniref:glutamate synthase subunit beta n=1 Tax=Staphylococcus haemolyticus TaxID=1283 RepID=UPI002DBA96B9|nr:glutamate synthase subunit beta [Staphylococcus haemolyticus]MEB6735711.1 glutamate synthase subunit beta [Staphylococcus haemolyticus]